MNNFIMIIIIIAVVAFIFLIKYLLNLGADKAQDAIKNAKIKSDMQKNPPKQENLADRYKNND